MANLARKSASMCTHYAEIIVPLRASERFTYIVPAHLQDKLQAGMRVWVFFGHKLVMGWVWTYPTTPPDISKIHDILAVVDEAPLLVQKVRGFYTWIANYYMVPLGKVLQAAIPTRLQRPTPPTWRLNKENTACPAPLLAAFSHRTQVSASVLLKENKTPLADIAQWLKQGLLHLQLPRPRRTALPKKVHLSLTPQSDLKHLSRSPKQQALLAHCIQLQHTNKDCLTKELATNTRTRASLQQLLRKGYLIATTCQKTTHTNDTSSWPCPAPQPTKDGVSSPMLCPRFTTETLLKWIKWLQTERQAGKYILWVLPTQAALDARYAQLEPHFDEIGTFHGNLPKSTQNQSWQAVANKQIQLMLTIRKGVLLPYPQINILLIEEDQQEQLKEQQRSFRYHARDVGLMCGRWHQAATWLFSSTPALESLHKTWQGQYQQHPQPTPIARPTIHLAATQIHTHTLTEVLTQAIEKEQQVLLFHPHKGYGGYVQCSHCKEVPRCNTCNLVYTAGQKGLYCKGCMQQLATHLPCTACQQTSSWHIQGTGTDQITEQLQLSNPSLRIGRWEGTQQQQLETTETPQKSFQNKKLDILIATAHMLYGWQTPWTGLVLLWGCEGWLYKPHYRADEHFMQWLYGLQAQLAGQHVQLHLHTHTRKGYVLLRNLLASSSYESFMLKEAHRRKMFAYPPYTRLVAMHLTHAKAAVVAQAQQACATWLQQTYPHIVTQVGPLLWQAKRNNYTQRILLRLALGQHTQYKAALHAWAAKQPHTLYCRFEVDV